MARSAAFLAMLGAAQCLHQSNGVYPRTSFQTTMNLPLSGSSVPGKYNLIFIAEEGHDLQRVASGICAGISTSFNATEYLPRCMAEIKHLARDARGLRMQHDDEYATAVNALQERLGNDGHLERDFGETTYNRPFRAQFWSRLLRGMSTPPATVCETGFGAGHSSLLFLLALPHVRVHAFDHGLAKHTIPAHDWLDERYPDRLLLYLGDSYVTVPQLVDYYPDVRCNVVHVDGSKTAASVRADLTSFAAYVPAGSDAPGAEINGASHVLVLQGASEGSAALSVWAELVEGGFIVWEGTVRETPASPASSDALVYGRYTGKAAPPRV